MPSILKVNFKGVQPAGPSQSDYIDPGSYEFEIFEVSPQGNRSSTKKLMPWIRMRVKTGPMKGKRIKDNFTIESDNDDIPFGLMRLRAMLESAGVPVKDGAMSLDLERMVGRSCYAEVYDDEYNNRKVSKVGGYIKPQRKRRPVDDDEDDDEEADAEDDEDDDEDDDEEEEEEEEEAPPKRRAKPAAKKAKKPAARKRRPADDDDDDDDEEEDDDDFPFDDDD